MHGISLLIKSFLNQNSERVTQNSEMRMQDGYSKLKQNTEMYGQVGGEKMGKDTIINDH